MAPRRRDRGQSLLPRMARLGSGTLLGMSRSTLWSKIRDPREFRLGELLLLYDVLHFSDEDRRILL